MIIRQSGTLAQRPTPNPTAWWGHRYYATDTQQIYEARGGTWIVAPSPEKDQVSGWISGVGIGNNRPSATSYLGWVYTDTATGNQYEGFPDGWVAIVVGSGGGGGGSTVLTPTSNIQTALNSAASNSRLELGVGTWDLADTSLEVPDNVSMKGAGMELTIIKSRRLSNLAEKHGILAPGLNSEISDLSIIAYSATGTDVNGFPLGNEDCNPFSARTGKTKNWDNVIWRNVHFFGLNDCIYSQGGDLKNNLFINCIIEGQCDLVIHQNIGTLTFINCELRHIHNPNTPNLTATGFFTGNWTADNIIRAYGCRYVTIGVHTGHQCLPIEPGGPMYISDFLIDYRDGPPSANSRDLWLSGDVNVNFLSNIRRADGKPLTFDAGGATWLNNLNVPFTTTVALLPDSSHAQPGQEFFVTDGTAALAWGATVTGGGATKYKVMWNGANWTVCGK